MGAIRAYICNEGLAITDEKNRVDAQLLRILPWDEENPPYHFAAQNCAGFIESTSLFCPGSSIYAVPDVINGAQPAGPYRVIEAFELPLAAFQRAVTESTAQTRKYGRRIHDIEDRYRGEMAATRERLARQEEWAAYDECDERREMLESVRKRVAWLEQNKAADIARLARPEPLDVLLRRQALKTPSGSSGLALRV